MVLQKPSVKELVTIMNQNLTPSLIKDINPGAESSNPSALTNVNGILSFVANENELWKSDGTTQGTVQIPIDNLFGDSVFRISNLIGFDDNLFLVATSVSGDNTQNTLFKTDFTQNGTVELFQIGTSTQFSGSDIGNLTPVNDNLFFTSKIQESVNFPQSTGTNSLLKTDGTTSGTSEIRSFTIDSLEDNITQLSNVNGTLFFAVSGFALILGNPGNIITNNELWKSDGTEAGTVQVKDINPGSFASSNPNNLTDINDKLFFTANDGTNGRELWKSDGTETGTVLIKDINAGGSSSNPDKLTDVNGTAFFTANNGTNGTELWKSDGTESGTVLVKDIIPGSEGSTADNLTNVNGTLFFTVNDGVNGTELWKSDGTESGTGLVKDINPGTNSNPDNLTNFEGTLYFTADDGVNGTELWKSDGTEPGTVLVEDINRGSASSNPDDLTIVNGELYFSADDGVNGRELWGLTETAGDLILGGSSTQNDVLVGGDRDNIIDGLKGNDTLTGGGGKDKFILSLYFGNDVITDFRLGEDEIINTTESIVLAVASVGDAIKVAFSNTGDLLQVNLNGNNQAELENYLLTLGSSQAIQD